MNREMAADALLTPPRNGNGVFLFAAGSWG